MKRIILPASIGTILVILISVHIGIRWYKLNEIIKTPDDKRRISQLPATIILSNKEYDKLPLINFGYGTFMSNVDFQLNSRGNHNNVPWGESTGIIFFIVPPSESKMIPNMSFPNLDILEELPINHICRTFMTNKTVTIIENEILLTEYTPLRPFHEILFMGELEFRLYLIQLHLKCSWKINPSETYLFSSPHTKGYVHITKQDNKEVKVHCSVESQSNHICTGLNFVFSNEETNNIIEIIKPILATLSFNEGLEFTEEFIAQKINDAGIKPHKKIHNQRFEPVVASPVDDVEAQSTQAHP